MSILYKHLQLVADHYHWIETEKHGWVIATESEHRCRVYNSMSEPELWRTFANIYKGYDAAQNGVLLPGILAFVSKWGLLGVEGENNSYPPELGNIMDANYEQCQWWLKELREMRYAVDLYDAASSNDQKYLKEHIIYADNSEGEPEQVGYRSDYSKTLGHYTSSYLIAIKDWDDLKHGHPVWETLQPRGVILPARWCLQSMINDKLKESYNGTILWTGRSGTGNFKFFLQPNSLLSSMWTQFARTVSGEVLERYCLQCDKPIPNVQRASKKFCSDVCKNKFGRQSKKTTRE